MEYTKPSITVLGSFSELTLTDTYKDAGTSDVIHIVGLPTIIAGPITNVS